jgi:hypothetical protein
LQFEKEEEGGVSHIGCPSFLNESRSEQMTRVKGEGKGLTVFFFSLLSGMGNALLVLLVLEPSVFVY